MGDNLNILKYINYYGLGSSFSDSYSSFMDNYSLLFIKKEEKMKKKIKKESEITEEIKKIPKDKTLAQKLLPGIIVLLMGTILTLSIKSIQSCDIGCLLKGGGVGTIGLIILYIIGKALKDYGFY